MGSAPAYSGGNSSNNAPGPVDANGDIQGGGAFPATATWDVENRLVSSQSNTTYVYDPWGRRVWKLYNNRYSGQQTVELYFRGIDGKVLETYGATADNTVNLPMVSAPIGINTYFAGHLLSEKGVYVATDRLGSVRGDSNGVAINYFPWGEERTNTADGRTKFAGYYRDGVGQDYANARYYSATAGSFWNPDPSSIKTADTSAPLSWNRYAYAVGDPVNHRDPTGKNILSAIGGAIWDFLGGGGDDEALPDESGEDDEGFDTCGGNEFDPSPSPACYAPVPPPLAPKPTPYLAAIQLVSDCYDRSASAYGLGGGAKVDDLTYIALDQYGNLFTGPATITEQNTVIQGSSTSINTSWTLQGGSFTDYISSGAGQPVFQENESYFLSGSSTPLTIDWFFNDQYAVLGIYATPSKVIINNTVPVNKNGTPHYCDQPASSQVK